MMDLLSQLLVVALFSLHQYVPREQMPEKYLTSTVTADTLAWSVDPKIVVASAHQTCRFFLKNAQSDFQMSEQELVNFLFSLIDQKADALTEFGSTPNAIKKTVRDVCRQDFQWSAFSENELISLNDFIQKEFLILNPSDLGHFGRLDVFGRSFLYDRNGAALGSLNPAMSRWVAISEMSPSVPQALIAAEDKTFFAHQGVELSSFSRILFQMKSDEDSVSGGSTLTMQLLKNFYFMDRGFQSESAKDVSSSRALAILRKVREWFWAKPFEDHIARKYSSSPKEKILEYYLNLMDYGPQIRGLDQAAKVFFNKNAQDLSIADAAFLASLFKGPQRYSQPRNYEKFTAARRTYVLQEMSKLKWSESQWDPISQEELASAQSQPLPQWSRPHREASGTPSEIFHLQTLARESLVDFYQTHPDVLPVESEVLSTIDSQLQKIVFDVVREKLDSYDNDGARNRLDRVQPVRDDRARQARIEDQDISPSLTALVRELRTQLAVNTMPAPIFDVIITLNAQKNFADSLFYFSPQNVAIKNKKDLEALLGSQVLQTQAGYVYVLSVDTTHCPALTNQKTPELLAIPQDCVQEVSATTEIESLKNRLEKSLKIQFLKRLTAISQRENIQPAILDAQGQLWILIETDGDSDLKPIRLKANHQEYLQNQRRRGAFSTENAFWVQKLENDVYQLEPNKLQAAVVVMDSKTGEVYAHFGGYRPENSRFFDRALVAKRQPGSTLKPWLYYLALTKGFEANSVIANQGVVFPVPRAKDYVPNNFSRSSDQSQVLLSEALKNSYNKAAVGLLTDPRFGLSPQDNLLEFVRFLTDIEMYDPATVQIQPSIVLGAQEVSLIDLTSSFTFFANGQSIVKPTFFKSIKNGQGVSVFEAGEPQTVPVPAAEQSWNVEQIQRLLISVANEGTARRLLNFPYKTLGLTNCDGAAFGIVGQICFAGKTGTSSDLKDNWFIGTSRHFTIGVWIGYDYRESTGATGGELALPIFMDIIQRGKDHLPAIEPLLGR